MYNLYSRRQLDKQGNPEVFVYDNFPTPFRNQFFTIIKQVFEKADNYNYDFDEHSELEVVCKMFAQEKGLKYIQGDIFATPNSVWALESYLDDCSNEDFLDFMDFIFGAFISNKDFQNKCIFLQKKIIFFKKQLMN